MQHLLCKNRENSSRVLKFCIFRAWIALNSEFPGTTTRWLSFEVSHPFDKKRRKDGAREICGRLGSLQHESCAPGGDRRRSDASDGGWRRVDGKGGYKRPAAAGGIDCNAGCTGGSNHACRDRDRYPCGQSLRSFLS